MEKVSSSRRLNRNIGWSLWRIMRKQPSPSTIPDNQAPSDANMVSGLNCSQGATHPTYRLAFCQLPKCPWYVFGLILLNRFISPCVGGCPSNSVTRFNSTMSSSSDTKHNGLYPRRRRALPQPPKRAWYVSGRILPRSFISAKVGARPSKSVTRCSSFIRSSLVYLNLGVNVIPLLCSIDTIRQFFRNVKMEMSIQ